MSGDTPEPDADATLVTREISRMDGEFTSTVEVDERVDIDALMVIFSLEGEVIEGGKTYAWVDMRTVPAVGDAIQGRAIGMGGGFYLVKGRGWLDHNLVSVVLSEVDAVKPVRARVRTQGRDLDDMGPPPEDFVFVVLEVPAADFSLCDYMDITPSAGDPT